MRHDSQRARCAVAAPEAISSTLGWGTVHDTSTLAARTGPRLAGTSISLERGMTSYNRAMRRLIASAVIAIATLGEGQARAEANRASCPPFTDAFVVLRGELVRGRACGTAILTTDASTTRLFLGGLFRHHSIARVAWREPVRPPFEASLEWQFVTPGRWSLELDALGVTVLISNDRLGFFIDDSQMMGTLFEDVPGVGGPARRRIAVRRTAKEIVVFVEGREVGRKTVAAPASGSFIVGLRAAPGHRSRGQLRSLAVRELPAARD